MLKIATWNVNGIRAPAASTRPTRVERDIETTNRSLARSRAARYDRERKELNHNCACLPIIAEACQEQELAYEYRNGTNAYGAFTFCLVRLLRELRRRANPRFTRLAKQTAERLLKLGYKQTPALVAPRPLLSKPIPWTNPARRRR